ncbi:protease inhibitor I42 family protein [Candidatus Poribacteria bacterium]
MIRFNHTNTGFTVMIAIFLIPFIMMSSGCDNEPILTEPSLDEVSHMDAEPAPDIMEVDNGSETIEVETGEQFTISLQSNPTTGYSWQPKFDSRFLELVESKFASSSPELIGAGGLETFVFLAHREGQAEITLEYQRPWEDQPIGKQSRKVNITDSGISILNGTMGEAITISLISNPTTGYTWHPEFDSSFLKLVNRGFASDSTKLGSPGMETFEFLMLKQGEVRVKMIHKRPWENEILDEHVTLIKIHPSD